ncbi:MAG: hypothetical protein AB7G93_01720 [Bdellovibrionales bacterium]
MIISILTLSFASLLLNPFSHASKPNCSIDLILAKGAGHRECAAEFVRKIPDSQDQAEAKYLLKTFTLPKDLSVVAGPDMIQAVLGQKVLVQAVWLKRNNPAVLWLDGKILVDNSGNPSLGRRIDNLLRKRRSASFDISPFPRAFAESGSLARKILYLYSLDQEQKAQSAANLVATDSARAVADFLPAYGGFFYYKEIVCKAGGVISPQPFDDGGKYGTHLLLNIEPLSPTDFIVTGLKKNQTHLIRLDRKMSLPMEPAEVILDPRHNFGTATLAACRDPRCNSTDKPESLADWNLTLGRNPAEQKKAFASAPIREREYAATDQEVQKQLMGRLFGMSVMGGCCEDPECRKLLEEKYSLKLVPAEKQPATGR